MSFGLSVQGYTQNEFRDAENPIYHIHTEYMRSISDAELRKKGDCVEGMFKMLKDYPISKGIVFSAVNMPDNLPEYLKTMSQLLQERDFDGGGIMWTSDKMNSDRVETADSRAAAFSNICTLAGYGDCMGEDLKIATNGDDQGTFTVYTCKCSEDKSWSAFMECYKP